MREHIRTQGEFENFVQLNNLHMDVEMMNAINAAFEEHRITYVFASENSFLFEFSNENKSLKISFDNINKLKETLLSQLSKKVKIKTYDPHVTLSVITQLEKLGFILKDYNDFYTAELSMGPYTLGIELKPYEKYKEHGRAILSKNGEYLSTLEHRRLYTAKDASDFVKSVSKNKELLNIVEELASEFIPEKEELYNLGFKEIKVGSTTNIVRDDISYVILIKENEIGKYLIVECDCDTIFVERTSQTNLTKAFKHILERTCYEEFLSEKEGGDFSKIKKDFLEKEYPQDESTFKGSETEKLYDFFLIHDMSTSDTLFDYLKAAVKQEILESVSFNKPNLKIVLKNGEIEVKMKIDFSHMIGNKPFFVWKPKNYIRTIEEIRSLIKVKREKADMAEVKTTNTFKKLKILGFLDGSTKEDNINRSIILKKGIYSYEVHSDGSILRVCKKMKYSILLKEIGYLHNLGEYESALEVILENYRKHSKESGFQKV